MKRILREHRALLDGRGVVNITDEASSQVSDNAQGHNSHESATQFENTKIRPEAEPSFRHHKALRYRMCGEVTATFKSVYDSNNWPGTYVHALDTAGQDSQQSRIGFEDENNEWRRPRAVV